MNGAFYGFEEKEQALTKILATLFDLTGSMDCAVELAKAANEIEAANPDMPLIPMPPWVC